MRRIKNKTAFSLVELLLAFAIIVIVFAAVVPQFRAIRNSWATTEAGASIIQNGRVLAEHFSRNISAAKRIISVSGSENTNGYITFEDNAGGTKRYMLSGGYIVFGDVGSEAQLAGPVSSFKIACYSLEDFSTPATDVNDIRLVKFETNFPNDNAMGSSKVFQSEVFIQTNNQQGLCWSNMDIGSVAATGSATSSSCGWTIKASGTDIWDNSDEFHYVYQSLSGNGQIIARVSSVSNTNSWAKAGVMIRETLTATSKHAMMVVTPGNGTAFQRRTSTGSSSDHTAGSGVTAPYWVKLVRSGDTFSGYESPDGSSWTFVDSVDISMATNVYIGMAVTSHSDGVLCTAVIDSISSSGVMYENFSWAKAASDAALLPINTPANVSEGDLLIASVATDGTTSLTSPSGWTPINQGSDTAGQVTLGAWWKLAAASEPSSHTFTWTGGNQQAYGWIMRFTGHDSGSPINNWSYGSDSSASPISPAVTTTAGNCMILRLGAFDQNDITFGYPGLVGHTAITMDTSGNSTAGAVTYQGFGEGKQTGNLSNVTVLKPTGTSSGDLLIAAVATDGSTSATISAPAGWTLLNRGSDSGNKMTLGIWWKLAGTSEPASYIYTWTGNEQAYGWIMRFTGHNPTTPINAWGFQQGAATDKTPPCPSVTTTVANSMIVRIGGFDLHSININNPGLAGHTAITMDESAGNANSCSGGAGWKQQSDIGISGVVDFTLTGAQRFRTFTIAIAPSPAAGTVSGGAGYIKQLSIGDSGTSNFTLGSANEARTLTIAVKPADSGRCDCGDGQLKP
ncbi:MAG: hypothetical protein WC770_04070 [Phycisphaerae bacterium]|jgi:type II secretory pathway pseudopilin PulG